MLQMTETLNIAADTVCDTKYHDAALSLVTWYTSMASDWLLLIPPAPAGGNMCHFLSVFCHYPGLVITSADVTHSSHPGAGAANTNWARAHHHRRICQQ